MNKKILLLTFFVLLVLVLGVIRSFPDGKLHITACDVGQGDGSYLRMPNGADVVIDGGPDNKILACVGRKMPFYDRTIELVILTHPHKDHFFGLIELIRRYDVKKIILQDIGNEMPEYLDFIALLRQRHISTIFISAPALISIGDVKFNLLWPKTEWLSGVCIRCRAVDLSSHPIRLAGSDVDLNGVSLVFHLEYQKFDALLTGDADMLVEPLYRDEMDRGIEYLKVPHHGSKTGMSSDFISILKPRLSVVSVGKNSYGHPDLGLVGYLALSGNVFRTDKAGNVSVTTDGDSIWLK